MKTRKTKVEQKRNQRKVKLRIKLEGGEVVEQGFTAKSGELKRKANEGSHNLEI